MIDGKQLGTVGFQKLGTPYSEMDCQKFVEWCLEQCGLKKDLAGSNAWFREVYNNGAIMTPEECVKQLGTVPAGAFLFILEQDGGEPAKYKPDGLGNASHIGIVTGKGEGAIHSSASRGCVAESKFKNKTINGGWNRVGLYDKVVFNYGDGPAVDPDDPDPVTPDPAPEPVKRYATVWSEDDMPVNTRKGPGKEYGQSKAGKLACGTVVEILKQQKGWDYICCTDRNGAVWYCWMMDEFLTPTSGESETTPSEDPAEPAADPDEDFGPGDQDDGSGEEITLTVRLSREEASALLSAADAISWQLVQILGGRG